MARSDRSPLLDYETLLPKQQPGDRSRQAAGAGEPDRLAIQLSLVLSFFRQLAVAIGLGLLAFGTGYSIRPNGDGAFIMGWGGFILGLAIRLRRRESDG
jgi:hypothetical protein